MTVLLCSWPKRKIPLHSLHSRLGGASCKPHFCNVFCSLHDSHLQCISPLEIYIHCTCSLCKKQTNRQTKNTAKVRLAWGPTQTTVWSTLWYFPLRKHLLSGLGKTGTFWTLLNGNQFTINYVSKQRRYHLNRESDKPESELINEERITMLFFAAAVSPWLPTIFFSTATSVNFIIRSSIMSLFIRTSTGTSVLPTVIVLSITPTGIRPSISLLISPPPAALLPFEVFKLILEVYATGTIFCKLEALDWWITNSVPVKIIIIVDLTAFCSGTL